MITRSNYEEYFLDYHDGNLDASRLAELREFLARHPELKEEFESFSAIVLEKDDDLGFEGKEKLKKPVVTLNNYKTWFIAAVENDLTNERQIELNRFLEANPSLKPELEIFRSTKILPDRKIVFKNRYSLKRGGKVISFSKTVYRVTAVAAAIILLIVSYYLFLNPKAEKPMMVQEEIIPSVQKNVPENGQTAQPDTKQKDHRIQKTRNNKIVHPEHLSDLAHRNNPKHHSIKSESVKQEEAPVQSLIELPLANEIKSKEEPANDNNPVKDEKISTLKLTDVFTAEELNEFNADDKDPVASKPGSLMSIVQSGTEKLSQVTGTTIDVRTYENQIDNSKTFALEVGSFSFSRKSGK